MKYLLLLTVFLTGCQTTGLIIPYKNNLNEIWTSSNLVSSIEQSPNFEERKVSMIVIHHTGSNEDNHAINIFKNKNSLLSSHYLISRTGKITQLVDEEKRAYHAGVSSWKNIEDINSISVGIELSNDATSIYPEEQINSLILLSKDLISRHKIKPEMVVGHLEIAPGRKIDPYINFPWEKLSQSGITIQCEQKIEEIILPEIFSWKKSLSEIGYDSVKIEKSLISFRIRYFHENNNNETPTENEKKYMHCLNEQLNMKRSF